MAGGSGMANDEAIVRARITALKNVIAAREHASSVYSRPRNVRVSPYQRYERPYRPVQSRNLTWKAERSDSSVHELVPSPSFSVTASQNKNTANSGTIKSKPDQTMSRTEYCLYYNRFGVCNKKNACPYIHDSRKVAVCRKFLRNECDDPKCTLSHERNQNKMPVCTLFLKGMCTRDDCPYRHVNVNHEAAICEAFLKGYCPEGEHCRLKHQLPTKTNKAVVRKVESASSNDVSSASVLEPRALSIRPTIRFTPRVETQ
ncbi:Smad-interacting and CPSF-like [Thraustotheca clavata]|uniref:Smad-interacting and CPSF-like n=1 Tax=Thraustotheca clavata TaxID=74557 RepID=A0A1W0A1W5_9STRA|nr:Smad-interacting and CPSF-like [Thraustotheca clavata]